MDIIVRYRLHCNCKCDEVANENIPQFYLVRRRALRDLRRVDDDVRRERLPQHEGTRGRAAVDALGPHGGHRGVLGRE